MPNDVMNFGVDLLPIATGTYNLGSANKKWNIFGNLTGNVAWSNITSTPTTLSGYGITDAISSTTTVNPHYILAGPSTTNAANAAPTFRSLVDADIPTSLTLVSISAAANMTISTSSSKTITINSASTIYLNSGSDASILFQQDGTEMGRFSANGDFILDNTDSNTHKTALIFKRGAIADSTIDWKVYNNASVLSWIKSTTTDVEIIRFEPSSSTYTGGIVPGATNTYLLGRSDMVWANVYATTFTGDLNGQAAALKNLYDDSTRPINANIAHVTNGGVVHFKASSSMTSNKPTTDGSILHFHWDTDSRQDSQLFISDTGSCMQYRGHSDSSVANETWTSWKTLLDDSNYNSYALPLTGGTLTGALSITYANATASNYALVAIRGNNSSNPRTGGVVRFAVGGSSTNYTVSNIYIDTVGSTSAVGVARLSVGNSTASGTTGNYSGKIRLYGTGTAYSEIIGTTGSLGGTSRTYLSMDYVSATQVYGAVWNDYAEFRKTNEKAKPGNVVIDNDDGSLTLSYARLLPGAQVVSDTYGFAIGETKDAKTPLAVSGRVLVYTYRNRKEYHAGQAVCAAPNGTVDIMTRREIKEYPDAIIGIVSEIPDYEEWGQNNVKVDNRIWIKVR